MGWYGMGDPKYVSPQYQGYLVYVTPTTAHLLASSSTHLAALPPKGWLSYFLINTHFAFLIGNSGIVLEKHIPSRFDDGKYAL